MSQRIEDYGLVGDTHTAALIGRDGSVDWLCFPRFDSAACFAALLGDEHHGRWLLAPLGGVRRVSRRYRPGTLVLETEFESQDGRVRIVDCMPPRQKHPNLVRVVEGVTGRVPMRMQLVVRFEYGSIVPWVTHRGRLFSAVAGPDALTLRSPIKTRGEDLTTVAEFAVGAGESLPFVLTWHASYERAPRAIDARRAVAETEAWWCDWSGRYSYEGEWHDAVERSLIVLKALTYAPTGGIVAAATTSLPEQLGGVRNWDYRYCWLRTRRSRSTRSCLRATRRRQALGGTGSCAPSRANRGRCRSCTESRESAGSQRSSSPGFPATKHRRRFESGTVPPSNTSSMSTAS